MIPDNVTLIVKAPNQQIEDQNIDCESSWTILQLKGHLAEVYPSKPKTYEQKIIYSGQLLEDGTVLKDVLRTYESQIAYTVHLVCTPRKQKMETPPPQPPTNEGLRQRATAPVEAERPNEAARPETRQNDQNHTVEMQNYLSSYMNNYGRVPPYPATYLGGYLPVPNDPASMANHMIMMQQAYLQYMQQYANMWQAGGNTALPGTPPVNVINDMQQQAAAAAAGPEAEAEPPAEAGAEEGAAHDWLDWMYAASRAAILFSLVYFYSNPFRFLLVVLLCAMGYLYQVGFFRDIGLNPANNNLNRRRRRRVERIPNPPQPQPNPEPVPPAPMEPERNGNHQSILAVTWMIFTSFFTSLIPETN